jgi:radical SAM protein with 4Fe4S-binding SPASM domain
MSMLTSFKQQVSRLFTSSPVRPMPDPGLYHYVRETPNGKARLHLRIEGDYRGLLLVNANRAYQLNPTAAHMTYLHLEGCRENEAVQTLERWFDAPRGQLHTDFSALQSQLDLLTDPQEHCPLCELDLETSMPFSSKPTAPYRMDLALTYRCSNECDHCYNARSRRYPEMSTTEWKNVLDRLWNAGIPHIVFTGGEPTLRPDLPELVAHAEHNGQITGLNTNGRRLKDAGLVQRLVDAGLDHVQITLESHEPAIHNQMVAANNAWEETVAGIRNALATRLYVMTNTTLLTSNSPSLDQTLDFLAELGVPTIGLNALIYSGHGKNVGTGLPESSLPGLLNLAQAKTQQTNQRLIWYTPTRYCQFDPMSLDLGIKGCTAGLYAMCVEPDGAVLPCQSYYSPVGNLLHDPWEKIWNHDLTVALRERKNIDPACHTCDLLDVCGGGCPLSRLADPNLKYHPVHSFLSFQEVP